MLNWLLKNPLHRLMSTMLLSILLHLALFLPDVVHFDKPQAGRQITLQATLQMQAKAPPAPPPEEKKHKIPHKKTPKAEPGQEKFMTRRGKDELKITEKSAEKPAEPAEQTPELPDRAAIPVNELGAAPAYPAEAAKRNLEGCVLAAVSISAAGEVTDVKILHADVANLFDQSVIEAQRAAHYLPARKDGNNAPSRILTVASFILEPGKQSNCAVKYAEAAQKINALPFDAKISSSLLENLHAKP